MSVTAISQVRTVPGPARGDAGGDRRPTRRIELMFDTNGRSWSHASDDTDGRGQGRRSAGTRAAQLRRPRHAARRRHVLRPRPGDDGRQPHRRRHHRGRRGQGPRRRVPRHVPDARQPGPGHPAADHRPHRAHRRARGAGAAHRDGAAVAARVHAGHRDRRPQHRLRRRLPAGRVRARRAPPLRPGEGRHRRPRPPAGPRRGARLPPRHAGLAASASTTARPTAPSTTPWPRPTCCTC